MLSGYNARLESVNELREIGRKTYSFSDSTYRNSCGIFIMSVIVEKAYLLIFAKPYVPFV